MGVFVWGFGIVYAWLSVVKFGESVVGEGNVGVFGEV